MQYAPAGPIPGMSPPMGMPAPAIRLLSAVPEARCAWNRRHPRWQRIWCLTDQPWFYGSLLTLAAQSCFSMSPVIPAEEAQLGLFTRQSKVESGAARGSALSPQAAAVSFHNGAADGK